MLQLPPFKCPVCKSNQIEGRSIEVFEPHYNPDKRQQAEQICSCIECKAEWKDIYTRSNVEIICVPEST
jgi:predicted Zn-ribbon and HTH transcriptional regulator